MTLSCVDFRPRVPIKTRKFYQKTILQTFGEKHTRALCQKERQIIRERQSGRENLRKNEHGGGREAVAAHRGRCCLLFVARERERERVARCQVKGITDIV